MWCKGSDFMGNGEDFCSFLCFLLLDVCVVVLTARNVCIVKISDNLFFLIFFSYL